MQDCWLIIRTPDGVRVHQLGAVNAAQMTAKVTELRTALEVPEDADPGDSLVWDVQASDGEPHPSVLEAALEVVRLPDGEAPAVTPAPEVEPPRELMPHELDLADREAAARPRTDDRE